MGRKRSLSRSAETARIDQSPVTDTAMLTTAAGAMTLGLISGAAADEHRAIPTLSDLAPSVPASASLMPPVDDMAGAAVHDDRGEVAPVANDQAADTATDAPAARVEDMPTGSEPPDFATISRAPESTSVTHDDAARPSGLESAQDRAPGWQPALHAEIGESLQTDVSHIYAELGDSISAMTASFARSPALHGVLESATTLAQGALAVPAAAADALISAVFDTPAEAAPVTEPDTSLLMPVSDVLQPLHLGFLGQAHDQPDVPDGAFSALGLHHF